jgi:hypothetical protein
MTDLIFIVVTIIAVYLSDTANKRWGRKLLRKNYEQIAEWELRMNELRQLIILAMVHKEKAAQKGLQDEFNDLHGKAFFSRIAANSLFFVIITPYFFLADYLFKGQDLITSPVNYIFMIFFIYFVLKMITSKLINIGDTINGKPNFRRNA